MLLVIAALVVILILFGVGFTLHILWWIAIVALVLWLLGFVFRAGEGVGGARSRWYRW